MKWKNASKEMVPEDEQEVLISVDGIYHIAVYNSLKNTFKVKGSRKLISIDKQTTDVYWIELDNFSA